MKAKYNMLGKFECFSPPHPRGCGLDLALHPNQGSTECMVVGVEPPITARCASYLG